MRFDKFYEWIVKHYKGVCMSCLIVFAIGALICGYELCF